MRARATGTSPNRRCPVFVSKECDLSERNESKRLAGVLSALLAVAMTWTLAVPVAFSGAASRAWAEEGFVPVQAATLHGAGITPDDGKAYTLPVSMLKESSILSAG